MFAAYLAGHLGQALGNLLEKVSPGRRNLDKKLPLSPELGKEVVHALAGRFGEQIKTLDAKEMFHLCDQALIHCGSLGEREIFIYREGFYRGNAVALASVSFALAVRLMCVSTMASIGGKGFVIYRAPLVLAVLLCGVGAWLCYARFLRFAEHRYRSCFLRFLALSKEAKPK